MATFISCKVQVEANILFDEGSQRLFISQKLANNLQLHFYKKEDICLHSFGSQTPIIIQLHTREIYLLTRIRNKLPVSILITLTIATPLENVMQTHIAYLLYLQGISLAHWVTRSATIFKISLLIGADHYWNIIEGHIIWGNGPAVMNSKIGYLLSGPLSPQQTSAINISNVTVQHIDTEGGDLQKFWTNVRHL